VVSASPAKLRWIRRVLAAASVVALAFGVLTLRVVMSGEAQLRASDEALRRGDAEAAVVHARRSAGWYAPGAPHVTLAYQRLEALARAAEEHRRIDVALLAWRAVRSAAIETRWLLTPRRQDLERANREIARLEALGQEEGERLAAEQLERLAAPSGPRLPWVVALVAAFAMGAIGLGWWARAAAGPAGQLRWAPGPVAVTLAAVALWLLSLWRA
jgi:hypothetical protein